MRATITMPLETLKTIIERAREYEFVDEDQDFAEDDEEEDDEADSELDDDDDDERSIELADDDDDDEESEEDGDELDEDDEEFEGILEALKPEELAELLALSWVGEGDYDGSNWDEAMGSARALSTDDVIVELAENPLLADAIERGLVALGYRISDD
jgi:hypothetical protein